MREYQQQYLKNLEQVTLLSATSGDLMLDAAEFLRVRQEKHDRIGALVEENTSLLRKDLFPLLDDIITASDDDIRDLDEFAAALVPGNRDVMLAYHIHNALIGYARHHTLRDMLIRELYNTAMDLFYLDSLINTTDPYRYSWKMLMLFGEAASYIKVYDKIEDPEIRGYIHRSMGNLALGYHAETQKDGEKKLEVIRRSLQILNDPAYRQKTPSLPWDTYIYKSHQERTTALNYLRRGLVPASTIREVMESAEYVWEHNLEASRRRGQPVSTRWHATYYTAQYHCGVLTLKQLLTRLEELYMGRDPSDYSDEGVYCNFFLPALYASYVQREDHYRTAKKEVIGHMYRMLLRYVQGVTPDKMTFFFVRNLMTTFISFIEYPDGIQQRDYLLQLVVCRTPETFIYLQMTACTARILLTRVIEDRPELLVGVCGCQDADDVRAARKELAQLAYDCGMFHNIGQLNFMRMTSMAGRHWFKEEQELFQYHVKIGAKILKSCESTRRFASSAEGHHFYYDMLGGYPQEYDPREHDDQVMVDIVGIAAYFVRMLDNTIDYTKKPLTMEAALEKIKERSGTRFSPQLVRIFSETENELREYLKDGKLKACELALKYLKNEDAEN